MEWASKRQRERARERARERKAHVVLHKSFWHGSLAVRLLLRQQSAHHAMSRLRYPTVRAQHCLTHYANIEILRDLCPIRECSGWREGTLELDDVELATLTRIMGRTFHVLVLSLTHFSQLCESRHHFTAQTPENGVSSSLQAPKFHIPFASNVIKMFYRSTEQGGCMVNGTALFVSWSLRG